MCPTLLTGKQTHSRDKTSEKKKFNFYAHFAQKNWGSVRLEGDHLVNIKVKVLLQILLWISNDQTLTSLFYHIISFDVNWDLGVSIV